jgi:peptidylprolyl isomerase
VTFRHIAVTALVLALTATACGSDDKEKETSGLQDQIEVTGTYGEKPEIDIQEPVKVPETTSWTTVEGTGEQVGAEATTILALTLADGRTGKVAISTHDEGQRPLEIKLGDQVFPALTKTIVGQTAGSRVVVASTPEDAYGEKGAPQLGIKGGDPLVMVADILSTDPTSVLDGPTGETREPPADAPGIEQSGDELTGVDVSGLKKPGKYRAIVLREGTGPKVETDRIAADYLGQVWGAKEPFNNTYGKEPVQFSIGLGGVIPAWDKGLTGLKEGARVMLICPPETAYGAAAQPGIPASSTLVFVIDVLGVG